MGRFPFFSLRSMRPGMARLMADSMCEDSYSSWGLQSSNSRELAPDSSSSCSHSTLLLDIIVIVTITEHPHEWLILISETLIPPSPAVTWEQHNRTEERKRKKRKKNHGAKLPFPRPPPPTPPLLLPLFLRAQRTQHTLPHARTHIQHTRSDAPPVGAGNLNMQRFLSLLPSVRLKRRFDSSPSTVHSVSSLQLWRVRRATKRPKWTSLLSRDVRAGWADDAKAHAYCYYWTCLARGAPLVCHFHWMR